MTITDIKKVTTDDLLAKLKTVGFAGNPERKQALDILVTQLENNIDIIKGLVGGTIAKECKMYSCEKCGSQFLDGIIITIAEDDIQGEDYHICRKCLDKALNA